MEAASSALVGAVSSTLADLSASTLNDPETDMAAAHQLLQGLEARLVAMEGQAATLLSYQQLMDRPQVCWR
jgi:hypothetical protein